MLHRLLHRRAEAGHPVGLGVIGAGRMGTEVLAAGTGRALDALPIGLSRGARLTAPVAQGEVVTHGHVALDDTDEAVRARRAMAELMGA